MNKINSCEKLIDNFLDKDNKKLSTEDFINLVLVFILTFLFILLICIIEKIIFGNYTNDLGYPFWGASFIFALMCHFRIPKRFFH